QFCSSRDRQGGLLSIDLGCGAGVLGRNGAAALFPGSLPVLDIVTLARLFVLILGPLALVSAAYALSFSPLMEERGAPAGNLGGATTCSYRIHGGNHDALARTCDAAAADLSRELPSAFHVIVRPPFVLAGDLPEEELDELHLKAVLPVASALWRS